MVPCYAPSPQQGGSAISRYDYRGNAMYDDYGLLKAILGILLIVGFFCVSVFFEWQAYAQAIEVVGGEPSIPAFIGWIL